MSLTRTLVFILLSCLQTSIHARVPMSFMKYVDYETRDFIMDFSIGNNITFTYSMCDQESNLPTKTCVLALEIFNGEQGQKFCTVKLHAKGRNKIVAREYALAQTSKDDVLFLWKVVNTKKQNRYNPDYYARESLKARLVHMSTCEYEEVNFMVETRNRPESQDRKIKSVNVVTYGDGSFDIVYRNKALCGETKKCKLMYDPEHRKFIRPNASSIPVDTLATLSTQVKPLITADSYLSGYIVHASTSLQSGSLTLLDPNGELLLDHKYSHSIFDNPEPVANIATSFAYGLLGFCQQYVDGERLDCSQFDGSGNATLGVAISLRWTDLRLVRMLNIKDGGFAVLIGYRNTNDESSFRRIDVLRVDAHGQLKETNRLNSEKCSLSRAKLNAEMFERTGFDYCYYTACLNENGGEFRLKVDSKCFEKEKEVNEASEEDEEEEEEDEW